MTAADPRQQVEARIFAFIEHEVEQYAGDALLLEKRHGVGRRRRDQWAIAEILEVDAQLLLHRRLVLHDQHGRPKDLRRPVDLQPRRQGRQPRLPSSARRTSYPAFFQDPSYMNFNDYSRGANT